MKHGVDARRFDRLDLLRLDEPDAIPIADDEPIERRPPLFDLAEEREQPPVRLAFLAGGEHAARVAEGVPEPFRVDRLQQEVHGVHGERPDRVLVVRRDEDDERDLLRFEFLEHLEPVEHGHLHVEQHEIGPKRPDRAHRLRPVEAHAGDLDVGLAGEQAAQALDGQRLVVHEQGADHAAFPGAAPPPARGASVRSGSRTDAWKPPPARAPHSRLAPVAVEAREPGPHVRQPDASPATPGGDRTVRPRRRSRTA